MKEVIVTKKMVLIMKLKSSKNVLLGKPQNRLLYKSIIYT